MAYSFNLSVGTKYFAIHVVSDDQFALFVDDICYEGRKPILCGYNICRDGKLYASLPATSNVYYDRETGGNWHDYCVTALYDIGE